MARPGTTPVGRDSRATREASGVLTVETAAIQIGDAVFTLPRPNRHHNIVWWLSVLGVGSDRMHDQGFVLSNGQYASRTLAAKLALANGQVSKLHAPPNLFSEDLWDGGFDLPMPTALRALTAPGEAEELAGVVDGWRERAEAAEAKALELEAALKQACAEREDAFAHIKGWKARAHAAEAKETK